MDELRNKVMLKLDKLVDATRDEVAGNMPSDAYVNMYGEVLDDLVQMVIVSVVPPIKKPTGGIINMGDDYSESKERWIAR